MPDQSQIESTERYLGIDIDAIEIAERFDIRAIDVVPPNPDMAGGANKGADHAVPDGSYWD